MSTLSSKVYLCNLWTWLQSEILDSLRQLARGRTTIFIAHRLSTARQCDEIVVLEKGQVGTHFFVELPVWVKASSITPWSVQVLERGSHDELLAAGGRYTEMWEQQSHNGDTPSETSDADNSQSGARLRVGDDGML
eukprot:3924352-Pyramimonas_sp.AAC.1